MRGKSCFFIGHREASEAIYPAVYSAVEQHILEYGVTEFIVGHYGGFDRRSIGSQRSQAFRPRGEAHFTVAISSGGAAHTNTRWI